MKSFYLKILLSVIFLLVSVFFAFKISELYNAKNYFTEEEIAKTVKVLEKKGTYIDKSVFLKNKTVPKVIKIALDASSSEEIAKRVMKGDFGTFTVPDGYSYTNADETLSFSYDYSIEYSLLSSGISREDAEKAFLEGSASDTEKTEKLLTKFFFSDMNSGPYKVTMKALRCVEKDGVLFVEAVECVDGIEVKGAKILSALKNGEPVFLSGRLFFSKSYTDYKTDAHDSVNILFEIEKNDLKIEKMQILYIPVFEEKGSVYLTPSYSFTYSDGSEEIYDATSAIKRN